MSNMVIRTNILSLNSHRNLGMTGSMQARSSARLSSGFRINTAADDAAGLGISEKMRGQIRGLDQASRNAQDGISLIQTAEGAMQTVNDIVIRVRELIVQAANDTNVHEAGNEAQSDRARIQDEINQLLDEVDQIAGRTEFNTRTLLNGDWAADRTVVTDGQYVVDTAALNAAMSAALTTLIGGLATAASAAATGVAVAQSAVNSAQSAFDTADAGRAAAEARLTAAETLLAGLPAAPALIAGGTVGDAARALLADVDAIWSAMTPVGSHIPDLVGAFTAVRNALLGATQPAALSANATAPAGTTVLDALQAAVNNMETFVNSITFVAAGTDASAGVTISWGSAGATAAGSETIAFDTIAFNAMFGDGTTSQAAATMAGEWTTALSNSMAGTVPALTTLITDAAATVGLIDVATRLAAYAELSAATTALAAIDAETATTGTATLALNSAQSALATAQNALVSANATLAAAALTDAQVSALTTANTHYSAGATVTITGGNSLWFHIGANEGQGIRLNIRDVSVAALGLSHLRAYTAGSEMFNVSAGETGHAGVMRVPGEELGNAGMLNELDEALSVVTQQRSLLGAMQNRLEFTIENLDVASENLSAANSRIRDADMAREMMRLTQMNVLQQAATAMLAQANQAPQMVLQLLG